MMDCTTQLRLRNTPSCDNAHALQRPARADRTPPHRASIASDQLRKLNFSTEKEGILDGPSSQTGSHLQRSSLGGGTAIPSRAAAIAACVLLDTLSARKTAVMCAFTVRSARPSSRQMTLLEAPPAINRSTSIGRRS